MDSQQQVSLPQNKTVLQKYWWVVAILIFLLALIAILTILQAQQRNTLVSSNTPPSDDQSPISAPTPASEVTNTNIMWSFDGETWTSSENPPTCEDQVFVSPADISNATFILYPGQTRGGDFKPHGGIAFGDILNNEVTVSAPANSYAFRGSRYIEDDEIQYIIDFIVPCGYMYRFDHLLTLSQRFQSAFESLPEAQIDDSRTYNFENILTVEKGEVIATSIGHLNTNNASFDWGVYDLRQRNEVSQDAAWSALHADEKEQAFYAVCWLDLLPANEMTIAKSLPGPGTEGKESDYCD